MTDLDKPMTETTTLYGHLADDGKWDFTSEYHYTDTHWVRLTHDGNKPLSFGPVEKIDHEEFADD